MSGPGDVGPANGGPDEGGPAEGPAQSGRAEGAAHEQGPADGEARDSAGDEYSEAAIPADSGAGDESSEAAAPADSGNVGSAGGGAHGGGPADGATDSGAGDESREAATPADSGNVGSAGGGAHGGGPADGATDSGAGDESSEAAAPAGTGSGASGGGTSAGATAGPAGAADPAELLGEMRAIRRRARLARHAYWFPLVLFGLLTCASVPFYLPPTRSGTYPVRPPGPQFLQSGYLGGFGLTSYRGTAYYWLGAMLLGIAATVLWYRWRGGRIGLRTPARGFLITGLIIVALALLIPLVSRGGVPLMPGDLVVRGTFPFVLIGLGLCVLAWAERSAGLAVIAAVYLALALVASLYDIENVFYNWFGRSLGATVSVLPNVLLPALVLLLTGAGAWVVQRRFRPPAEPEPAEG